MTLKAAAAAAPPVLLPEAIHVSLRRPAEIAVHAPLARLLLSGGKPSGWRRWWLKASRALFHLVHQRLGRPARATVTPAGGAPFAVDCANTGFLDYARRNRDAEGVEPAISGLVAHLAPRLATVYDIGANWGYYPLLLGTEPRFTGAVHAFEVRPRTVADLRHVAAASGLGARVTIHEFGLSDRDGAARLAAGRHSYLARIVGADHAGATETVTVRRLDGLALPPPQLIKLDVEGHELAVLRGAAQTIARYKPLIVLESWHCPGEPETMLEPLRLLAAQGYEFRRLVWHGTAAARGRVALEPLSIEGRPAFAATLDLLAVHPATAGMLL